MSGFQACSKRCFVDEEWRSVVGFDFYEVSNLGRVRSLDRPGHPGRIRKLSKANKHDRSTLSLYKDGAMATRTVHILVLEAFVGPRPAGMEGCHNDGDANNCVLRNLRWDTPRGNAADKKKHGTELSADTIHNTKIFSNDLGRVLDLRANGVTLGAIGSWFGCSKQAVHQRLSAQE